MLIQKITSFQNYNTNLKNKKSKVSQDSIITPQNLSMPVFTARVDKGLERFYEVNKTRMPQTLKNFIESLPDKTSYSPITAQKLAFIALGGAASAAAVQNSYPEEKDLFGDLKEVDESKATRGILGVYRENKELLKLCEQGILNDNQNFTVWLLKKIFLEAKTVDEINQDFYKEANPDFIALYQSKEPESQPIQYGVFKALGIKMPEFEYLQSLRYTRTGYSDIVGDKISQAQLEMWESMSPEERTARAKKSVEKFENWWNSMSRDQKLDLIAFQIDQLEMLNKFNSFEAEKNTEKTSKTQQKNKTHQNHQKTNVTSGLSRDDLFKIWSSNNLKIFEANLTDYDRKKIEIKREQKRAEWWASMTPEEKTEYINKLKTSSEPLRYAMIDAWNNNPDILLELSYTLKKNNFNRPADIIYGTEPFNKLLSETMTNFWAAHPDFAKRFGTAIHEAHDKVKESMNSGHFEILKQNILKARAHREKANKDQLINYREIISDEKYNSFPEHIKQLIDAFSKITEINLKILPKHYVNDFFEITNTDLSKNQVESWTKALNQEELTMEDKLNLNSIKTYEPLSAAIMNRALEATLAEVLYDCTKNPEVYLMSHTDCKIALQQVYSGQDRIHLFSEKTGRVFDIAVQENKINLQKIDTLYERFKTPISENRITAILENYMKLNVDAFNSQEEKIDLNDFLRYYIKIFAGSNDIIFSPDSKYPTEVKKAFSEKFINYLPPEIKQDQFEIKVRTIDDFKREEHISKINDKLKIKYDFLPEKMFENFKYEIDKTLRLTTPQNRQTFEEICTRKRKSLPEDANPFFIIPRRVHNKANIFHFLWMEQALADTLYEATGEPKVYALKFEELVEYIHTFSFIKKLQNESYPINSSLLNENFNIKLKKKPELYKLSERYDEYGKEFFNYLQDTKKNKIDKEDLLFTLNPYEGNEEIDSYTMKRIEDIIEYI